MKGSLGIKVAVLDILDPLEVFLSKKPSYQCGDGFRIVHAEIKIF